jgi:hypothetical protein
MRNVDVMLGEWQRSILGFGGGCELLFVYDLLLVSGVSQGEAPVILPLLHDERYIIVLCFVTVPQGHES